VLFDGECGLCNGFGQFTIKNDPKRRLRFAPLRSRYAQALLESRGRGNLLPSGKDANSRAVDSLVAIDGPRVWTRSSAVLRIYSRLKGPWFALSVLLVCPGWLRDPVYDLVAANRRSGRLRPNTCRLLTAEEAAGFIEQRSTGGLPPMGGSTTSDGSAVRTRDVSSGWS
jgi:predicted DCC family thiol-disulfide oxidoreductase YuxK